METIFDSVGPVSFVLGEGKMLVSAWKPLIILAVFSAWGWFVSKVLDKHAFRFHLGRENWAAFHLVMGLVALIAAFAIPWPNQLAYPVGLVAMILILAADVGVYVYIANKDERVPEEFRVGLDMSKWQEARQEKAAEKAAGRVELTITRKDKSLVSAPEAETEAFAIRVAAEQLIIDALARRASQVDVAPASANAYAVANMVDGVRQSGEPVPPQRAVQLIDFWKAAAAQDVSDRRRRQSSDITVEYAGVKHVVRVTSSGGQGGMRLTLLMEPAEAVARPISKLGMTEPQLKAARGIVEDGTGVVLLAAGADNGRTTTLYALTKLHDAYTSNVQTLELEPQATIEGVRQNVFSPSEGAEFGPYLRSLLRRDPDVVAVADVLDENAMKESARSDHDRTRIYLSFRAATAMEVIQIYMRGVGDVEAAGSSLRGVIAQRLVRKLCTNCRVPYQASPDVLKKLGLPADKPRQLYKKGGQVLIKNKPDVCPICNGGGYFGQTGIFEVFVIGPDEQRLIGQQDAGGLAAAFKKQGLPTLQQAAIMKAIEGVTSLDEVTRVLAADQPKKRPSSSKTAPPSSGPADTPTPPTAAGAR